MLIVILDIRILCSRC